MAGFEVIIEEIIGESCLQFSTVDRNLFRIMHDAQPEPKYTSSV
jgi:hypothetical protein